MILIIDDIEIFIDKEETGLRVNVDNISFLMKNLIKDELVEIIQKNYNIVKNYFFEKVTNKINLIDLKIVSIRIVLRYIYMYNLWRSMYTKEKHRDLTFLAKDFNNPQTKDVIINYFKEKYPNNFDEKSEVMLGMNVDEFRIYYKSRQDFENMF